MVISSVMVRIWIHGFKLFTARIVMSIRRQQLLCQFWNWKFVHMTELHAVCGHLVMFTKFTQCHLLTWIPPFTRWKPVSGLTINLYYIHVHGLTNNPDTWFRQPSWSLGNLSWHVCLSHTLLSTRMSPECYTFTHTCVDSIMHKQAFEPMVFKLRVIIKKKFREFVTYDSDLSLLLLFVN